MHPLGNLAGQAWNYQLQMIDKTLIHVELESIKMEEKPSFSIWPFSVFVKISFFLCFYPFLSKFHAFNQIPSNSLSIFVHFHPFPSTLFIHFCSIRLYFIQKIDQNGGETETLDRNLTKCCLVKSFSIGIWKVSNVCITEILCLVIWPFF